MSSFQFSHAGKTVLRDVLHFVGAHYKLSHSMTFMSRLFPVRCKKSFLFDIGVIEAIESTELHFSVTDAQP